MANAIEVAKPEKANRNIFVFNVLGMTEAQQVMCSSDIECNSSGMIGMMTKEECCMRQQEGVAYSTSSNTGSWSDTKVCTVCIGESHQLSEHIKKQDYLFCGDIGFSVAPADIKW